MRVRRNSGCFPPVLRAAYRLHLNRSRCRPVRPRARAQPSPVPTARRKLISETNSGMSRRNGFCALGRSQHPMPLDRHPGPALVELRGDKLDLVPGRQLIARHAHGFDQAVMAGLAQPVPGIFLDQFDMGLCRITVKIGVQTKIRIALIGLRMGIVPGGNSHPHRPVPDRPRSMTRIFAEPRSSHIR